jgi:hypothetical protein
LSALLLPGLFLVALATVAWFEYRREPVHRRPGRIAAAALVVAALLVLAWLHGPSSIRQVVTPGAPVSARTREAVALERLASPALLWRDDRDVQLTGWGLLPHEWPESLATTVTLDPAPLPSGIVAIDVPTEIGLGERLIVRGQLNLSGRDSTWVLLDDPSGPRDSMLVGGSSPRFQLADWPRAATAVEYRVRVRAGSVTLSTDTLGIAVRETRPPTVLILDGSPSFESTFLKRWLAGRGGSVTVRTTISRDRYRTEQVTPLSQRPQIPQIAQIRQTQISQIRQTITQITPAILSGYDAVLIDGTALRALSTGESAALANAVAGEGLGVLVTSEVMKGSESTVLRGLVGENAGEEDWSVKPLWTDAPRKSSVAILAEPVALASGNHALVRDVQGRTLAATQSGGNGRVGVTLLRTPSRWMLEGEGELYGSYWQLLLSAVARDTVTRVAISSDGARRVDEPLLITLTSPSISVEGKQWPLATIAGPGAQFDTIPFARDPVDMRLWRSTWWPTTPGWHTLHLAGGRSVPFRVNHAGEWIGLDASARRLASAARLGRAGQVTESPVSRLPMQLLLFLAIVGLLTWLWVEPRMGR